VIAKRHAATLIEFVARTALKKISLVSVMKRRSDTSVASGGKVEGVISGRGAVREAEGRDSEAAIGPDRCSQACRFYLMQQKELKAL